MGFLSQKVKRSELAAGDHIYTWRAGFIYSHHGIYVGEGKVVHFTQQWNMSSSSHSSSPCFHLPDSDSDSDSDSDTHECGCSKRRSGVITSCLDCFMGNGSLHRFEYGVNHVAFIAKLRGGTCTTAKCDPPEVVIKRAMYLLHNGFGEYDVIKNNCEAFALYCKTEFLIRGQETRGVSGQASSAVSVPVAVLLSLSLVGFVSNPVVLAAAAASMHSFNKYAHDVGVRHDVTKVKVEEMAAVSSS